LGLKKRIDPRNYKDRYQKNYDLGRGHTGGSQIKSCSWAEIDVFRLKIDG